VGPITATAMVAAVGDAKEFGRHLSAWLGLVPRQCSWPARLRRGRQVVIPPCVGAKCAIFPWYEGRGIIKIDCMINPSTDRLSFRSYAALDRADQTRHPKDRPLWTKRIANVLIAGVIAVVTIFVLSRVR